MREKTFNESMKRNIIIALTFCMSLASMAQTQVTEFNPGIAANGVNYVLPKTVLRMDASAIKVEYMPGEFAKYAERYIHSGDKLYIEGRIRYRTYDDQQGRRRYVTEIQADTLEMLVSKNPRQEERREEKPSNQEEAPF